MYLISEADKEKDIGNQFYKSKDYYVAIDHYNKAIGKLLNASVFDWS